MQQPKDLWYLVSSVKSDIQAKNSNHDLTFYKWAIDWFRELNQVNLLPTLRTAVLDINDDGSVDFPSDYAGWNKIGFPCNGYIINFAVNDRISLVPKTRDCDGKIISSYLDTLCNSCVTNQWAADCGDNWYYIPYHHNGQFVAGMYGRGEGFYHGGYRINEEKNQIQLDEYVYKYRGLKQVVLEYESNGGIDQGNAYIPDYALNSGRWYIHWQRSLFSIDPAVQRMKADYGRRYQRGIKMIVVKLNSMSAQQILSIVRASIHQLPKR